MTVKFYILQRDDETGKTRDKFLFRDELQELAVEKRIVYQQTSYLVKSLEWADKTLKVVCIEINKI